jgi:hypothetical protein
VSAAETAAVRITCAAVMLLEKPGAARMASILLSPCEYDIVFQELDEMVH